MTEQEKKLVQDIFLQVRNSTVHQEVMEEPEVYHRSLLNTLRRAMIKEAKSSDMLYHAVFSASYEINLSEARKELGRPAPKE